MPQNRLETIVLNDICNLELNQLNALYI